MSKLTLQSTAKLATGYTIPLLGLGVYKNNENPGEACLAAFRAGYRHVDSATMYGNEAQVGDAVRRSGIPRSELFITSKVASNSHGYEPALAAVDTSLAKFGGDGSQYFDLYLLHDPKGGKEKRLGAWKALIESKKSGKLRTVGVSNFGPKHLDEIVEAGLELPAVNQIEVQPFCQQKEIVEWCRKHDVLIQAYCPILRMAPGKIDHPIVVKVAEKHKKQATQVLIRWSLQKGYIPLVKSTKEERIKANADVYDFELDEQDMKDLDSLDMGANGAIAWNPVDAD
ncbi:Aldo/keto reductase [Exidia glandulosa HHB12029]|uniref:Aldo/keto reductase n=1 Tax=Exidia glandulosa HHB12029 TaxID=1314781 RepID=A0A165HP61_EXIGL|nr:Aldo/keto reductase [Exidia glandulosa HHB12029]